MTHTTDPKDPRLTHGADSEPTKQAEAYLVDDGEGEFIRPVRYTYIHVGVGGHEIDPNNMARHGRTGLACGAATRMSKAIAETYARNPKFYGATYCVGCQMHLPVAEFVWEDDTVVGS